MILFIVQIWQESGQSASIPTARPVAKMSVPPADFQSGYLCEQA